MSGQTKNDIAWEEIFNKYKILSEIEKNEYFIISASTIRNHREPRLMTKFDHYYNLPSIFQKSKLSILPITRGTYLISHLDTYSNLELKDKEITYVSFPEFI